MNQNWQSKSIEELIRFLKKFPLKSDDSVSVTLKGHLLIEELLVRYVCDKVTNPDEIKDFRFYHYLCLAKVLEKNDTDSWIWDACTKLNTLRNKLAHKLEPIGFDTLENDFIKTVEENDIEPPKFLVEKFGKFKTAIFSLHRALSFQLHYDYSDLKIKTLLTNGVNTERIRIDCVSEANHNLILWLDKPGTGSKVLI
jgi:hypothetical protein